MIRQWLKERRERKERAAEWERESEKAIILAMLRLATAIFERGLSQEAKERIANLMKDAESDSILDAPELDLEKQ